jgi:molybdenum cofactor cytidylyltransferase
MRPEDVALVLLAAGRSVRFGAAKLEAELWGLPLGEHAARALAGVPFARRIAVTGRARLDLPGFERAANPAPEAGLAGSVRLGVAAAEDAEAVLLVLADMPCVTERHVRAVLAACGEGAAVASSDGVRPSPPALFGRRHFPALLALEGDAGARELLRGAVPVRAGPGELTDVDTPEELERLRASPVIPA